MSILLACVSECGTDVTSPCLNDRAYSCGAVSPARKVGSGQLHVYIDELSRGNLQKRERETRRRANADAMREARARESREEGETRWRANADAMREARATVDVNKKFPFCSHSNGRAKDVQRVNV